MNLQPLIDNLLVVPDDPDTIVRIGDVTLEIVPLWHGDNAVFNVHSVQVGTVAAIPLRLRTLPGNAKDNYGYWRAWDVDIMLQPGDKVFFHHNMIKPERKIPDTDYYSVDYDLCYVAVRDGEIVCLDDMLLVEPVLEDISDKVSASGIILVPDADVETTPKPKYLEGIVRYMGKPTKRERGMYPGLEVGSTVIYEPDSDIELKVGGKSYYRMRYEDIMALKN